MTLFPYGEKLSDHHRAEEQVQRLVGDDTH